MGSESAFIPGYYVYVLRSQTDIDKSYIGVTSQLEHRLKEHNQSTTGHTARYRPWELEAAIWFKDKAKAEAFEAFLKEGSGHSFRKRHFLDS